MRSRLLLALLACAALLPLRADYDVTVTGTDQGSVWGSGPYTADSAIGKAAVHAGLISIGQVVTVRVQPLGTQSYFPGSVQNGIQTYPWFSSWQAISLSLAPGGSAPPTVDLAAPASVSTGGSFTLSATASDSNSDLVSHSVEWQGVGQIGWWAISGSSASHSLFVSAAPSTPGNIYFRTEATDAAGNITVGPWIAVSVTATQNQAPSASLSAPVSAYASNSFLATASASDPEGLLAQLALVNQWTGTVQSWTVSGSNATMYGYPVAPSSAGTIYLRTESADTAGATGASPWWGVAISGPPPTLSVSPTSVSADGTVTVAYSGAYPDAWIGLFAVGGASSNPLAAGAIPSGGAGTLALTLSPVSFAVGPSYEARYFPSGSYSPSAWSNTFTVTGAPTYMLTVENGSGSASGLVSGSTCSIHAGTPAQGESFWRWVLTSGAGMIQSLTAPSTVFTIQDSNANVRACFTSVAVAPNPAEAGGSVSVSYSGALTTANRVTLAHVGSPDENSLNQAYVPSAGQGTITFSLASGFATGVSYEARLMLDGTTVMARSAPFTIVTGTTHAVTVLGGTGGGSGLPNGSSVEIRAAMPPLGQKFSHWSLVSGEGVFADSTAPLTQVTLTNGSLTVQANTTAAVSSDLTVVGSTSGGSVWGTDVYTTDSDKARAVVHAGLLAPGQAGVIRTHQIGSWYEFTGTLRNEVSSMSYGTYPGMRLELLSVAPTYTLTVSGGTGGGSNFPEGTVRTLVATVPTGLTFKSWTHVSGPGALSSTTANPANFIVGAGHATVQAAFLDVQPPPTPTWNEPNNISAASVNLLWSSVTDASGIEGYVVFQDGVDRGLRATPNWWVTGLTPRTSYQFRVCAQDNAGNRSPLSTVLSVTTPADTTPPVAPINFYASSLTPVSVVLSWAAMYDNVGVTAYVVYQNGVALPHPPQPLLGQTARTITGLLPETTYVFQVRARDAALNLSSPSASLSVTTPADVSPPSVPGLPTATAITRSSLSLSWPPSTDTVGVTGYEIRVGGVVQPNLWPTNACALIGLTPSTSYVIELQARDAKGNRSAWSTGRSFSTSPPTPIVTSPLTTSGTYASAFSYTITASDAPTSFSATGLPPGLSLNASTGLVSGILPMPGNYPITVRGNNVHGAGEPAALTLTVLRATPIAVNQVVENVPSFQITSGALAAMLKHPGSENAAVPSGPVTYSATFTRAGETQTFVNFTPASLSRGLVPFDGPLTVTATYAGDSYYAPASVTAVFQNLDTRAPTTPTNLVSDYAESTKLGLRWQPSLDATDGSQQFRVYYDISIDGGTTTLTNSDRAAILISGLTPLTNYTLRVRARDVWGNTSGWSSPLTVTTLDPSSSTTSTPPTPGTLRDINGDGILDQIFPAYSEQFTYGVGETHNVAISETGSIPWTYTPIPPFWWFYVSWYPSDFYNAYLDSTIFIYDVITIHTYVSPAYTIQVEPLVEYAVYSLFTPTDCGVALSPRILENDPSAPVSYHTIYDGHTWEYNEFFATPQVLAKLGQGATKVRVEGVTGGVDLGTTTQGGGTLVETQQSGGEKILEVLDQFGRVIANNVSWELRRDGITISTGVGPIRIGISTTGTIQVGVKVQDSQYRWFNVLVIPANPQLSLAVDANRDGQIRFSHEDTSDVTAIGAPYRFWINDDDDGDALNDEKEVEGSTNPDYASRGDFGIASKRDLEDFARLWINSTGIADALKNGDLQLGLQWNADTVTGSPAVNFYRHYESDGGIKYLTDNATAIQQTTPPYSTTLIDAGNKNVVSSTNGVFILKKEVFANLSSSQTKTFLLFEGAGVGKGQLQLLLLDKSGNQVGEGSGVWMDIRRINTMFERVKATTQYALSSDGIDATMPLPHDSIDPAQVPQPTMGWTADDRGEAFVPDPGEDLQNKNYIAFVHGWRQAPGTPPAGVTSSLTYARTMFKRLWHAGYKGRFAAFRWPTFYSGPELDDQNFLNGILTYNDSEYRAWKAGESLAQYVNQLPSGYKRRIAAHSMGNVVTGSAFKNGMSVDSYALLNAAVPAIAYQATVQRRWPAFTGIYSAVTLHRDYNVPSPTPNAPDSGTPVDDSSASVRDLSYVNQLGAMNATNVINFYLESDFATSISWNANNMVARPDAFALPADGSSGYKYIATLSDPNWRLRLKSFSGSERRVTDAHEVMSYDCKVPTFTSGADGSTRGSILRTVDMGVYGFDREHSAQWQRRFQQTAQFYHDLLVEFGLTPTL